MNLKRLGKSLAALLLASTFSVSAHAAVVADPTFNYVFNFTGECDDCAFDTSVGAPAPGDIDFNPFNDGLTETVTATLNLNGVFLSPEGLIDYRGEGDVRFTYNGSSLINPFTLFDPFTFTTALLPTGQVQEGRVFRFSSSQNAANPETSFSFANFCTPLGQQVLGGGPLRGFGDACTDIGLVDFLLDSNGNFSVSGSIPFDIGTGGQLTPAGVSTVPVPAAAWLFGTGLIGLFGLARRKKSV